MNQSIEPQKRTTPRAHRRRLIGRPLNVTPSTKAEMNKAYNAVYRQQLVTHGIPDRRMLAEAIMQAVIEEAMSPTSEHAKQILRSAADILKSIVDQNKSQIYNNTGIKRRIETVANRLTPTGMS